MMGVALCRWVNMYKFERVVMEFLERMEENACGQVYGNIYEGVYELRD